MEPLVSIWFGAANTTLMASLAIGLKAVNVIEIQIAVFGWSIAGRRQLFTHIVCCVWRTTRDLLSKALRTDRLRQTISAVFQNFTGQCRWWCSLLHKSLLMWGREHFSGTSRIWRISNSLLHVSLWLNVPRHCGAETQNRCWRTSSERFDPFVDIITPLDWSLLQVMVLHATAGVSFTNLSWARGLDPQRHGCPHPQSCRWVGVGILKPKGRSFNVVLLGFWYHEPGLCQDSEIPNFEGGLSLHNASKVTVNRGPIAIWGKGWSRHFEAWCLIFVSSSVLNRSTSAMGPVLSQKKCRFSFQNISELVRERGGCEIVFVDRVGKGLTWRQALEKAHAKNGLCIREYKKELYQNQNIERIHEFWTLQIQSQIGNLVFFLDSSQRWKDITFNELQLTLRQGEGTSVVGQRGVSTKSPRNGQGTRKLDSCQLWHKLSGVVGVSSEFPVALVGTTFLRAHAALSDCCCTYLRQLLRN